MFLLLRDIPIDGKISIIKERNFTSPEFVRECYNRFRFLLEKRYDARGWTADVLKVVRELGKTEFTLNHVYSFDQQLQKLHPENKHIRPKIRQQLQILRDKGLLEFKGKGKYSFIR